MYVGDFPSENGRMAKCIDDVTELSTYRRHAAKAQPDSKTNKQRPDAANIDRFPCVDDIVDRLTDDTEIARRRVAAYS